MLAACRPARCSKSLIRMSILALHTLGIVTVLPRARKEEVSLVVVRPTWLSGLLASVITTRGIYVEEDGTISMKKLEAVWTQHGEYSLAVQAPMARLLSKLQVWHKVAGEDAFLVPCLMPEAEPDMRELWPMLRRAAEEDGKQKQGEGERRLRYNYSNLGSITFADHKLGRSFKTSQLPTGTESSNTGLVELNRLYAVDCALQRGRTSKLQPLKQFPDSVMPTVLVVLLERGWQRRVAWKSGAILSNPGRACGLRILIDDSLRNIVLQLRWLRGDVKGEGGGDEDDGEKEEGEEEETARRGEPRLLGETMRDVTSALELVLARYGNLHFQVWLLY